MSIRGCVGDLMWLNGFPLGLCRIVCWLTLAMLHWLESFTGTRPTGLQAGCRLFGVVNTFFYGFQ